MSGQTLVGTTLGAPSKSAAPAGTPCILVIFGASGDLTKRLLMPAIYNLACDGLLPDKFALVGIALDDLTTGNFRERMSAGIQEFNTRGKVDPEVWDDLVNRLHYTPGNFNDPGAYHGLAELVKRLDAEQQIGGNVLFYMATPPAVFGMIARHLDEAGLRRPDGHGWRRLIVEKPFGHDLDSAIKLNRDLLAHWSEDQIYRIDHYLGKETVQNLLAFRFSNAIFEPLWNNNHIDHIQFTVAETVGVEGRGGYYDKSGVLRDMIQNHMFQMLAYLCMEPPASFRADAVRNEKAKLLDAVRIPTPDDVRRDAVRGQYGPGRGPKGEEVPGYRQEGGVPPESATETFAAWKLYIDNWRWEGVPVYLRSGKRLWERGTRIAVQFKKSPEVVLRPTPAAGRQEPNQLLFHIQPDQGIEFRFHAKSPGPLMDLQKVNMRFDYREAFEAARGTGYEILLYHCMIGEATLFSRTDLVEAAWRVAQPLLDTWASDKPDFPNYRAGSWGPKAAYDLLARDGRRWVEVIHREQFQRVPLFRDADAVTLHNLAMMLKPAVFAPGECIVCAGELGQAMYIIARGEVEVLDPAGKVLTTLREGDFFGELSLLLNKPRTATVRAATECDLYVLGGDDFGHLLQDHPQLAEQLREAARSRYPAPSDKS
jgi:glucose-6-phosphate 1-dehydrogenase